MVPLMFGNPICKHSHPLTPGESSILHSARAMLRVHNLSGEEVASFQRNDLKDEMQAGV